MCALHSFVLRFLCRGFKTTHSSTLAQKIPWMEEPGRLQSMGHWGSDMTEWLHFHFSLSRIGEGNGNPLQCPCLENPRDGGAWWAAVYGVAQGQTRLKQLSSSSSSSAHITHKRHSGELSNYPTVFIFYWICLNYNWNFSKIVSVQNYLSVASVSSTNCLYIVP